MKEVKRNMGKHFDKELSVKNTCYLLTWLYSGAGSSESMKKSFQQIHFLIDHLTDDNMIFFIDSPESTPL